MERKGYIKAWNHEDSPLLWVETIYIGDTQKMLEYVGFSHDGHYFVSRNQLVTCYLNRQTLERAEAFGKEKYQDAGFIKEFSKKIKEVEKWLKKTTKTIAKTNLKELNNSQLATLYLSFVDAYSAFIGLYRFIRPEFYESVVEEGGVEENLKHLGERRFEMHTVWLEAFSRAQVLFENIGHRLDLSVLEITNSTSQEISDFLRGERKPTKEEIQSRIRGYILRYETNGFSITLLEDDQPKEMPGKQNTELQGQSAYPGVVQGKVFILGESLRGAPTKKMGRMRKGQILVTEMTSPDMILAIKKAAAIVTNHGGTLCHAAIVSREMKTPCVIGTEKATEALKDGDSVEVDADKGVVKILEQS